jgi:hypothetical protein
LDIDRVPEVMSPEAKTIFVAVPTVDDPNRRVCLQDAINLISNAILDLQSQITEVERRAALVDELGAAVREIQNSFDTLAKALHTVTVQARGLMGPKPTGVN